MGGQIQGVAQGYWVYDVTGSKGQLAMVMFCFTLPSMILAPVTGIIADRYNRKTVLYCCLAVLMLSAGAMALLYALEQLQYWHVLASATINGVVQTIEAPARQSVVRTVVGDEDLPAAIPAQAMTFNLSRILGPAIGGLMLYYYGVFPCFLINALSFSFLIVSVFMIKSDLRPSRLESGQLRDLVLEGLRFTFRSYPLRTLFLMEAATSVFGVFYVSLLPAYVKSQLGLGERELGWAQASIGIGAMCGLLFLSAMADKPIKATLARLAMTIVGIGVALLGSTSDPRFAYPLLGLVGIFVIMQFNTTNTLFQMMSPEALRGRVIAMHLWAISGVAPLGIFAFGWLAELTSLGTAFKAGGILLLAFSLWAWSQAGRLSDDLVRRQSAPGAA